MEAAGGAAALRAAFNDLLVFEQDFDTAMQILMFQDEKVARLSLEDAEHARSRRRATRARGAARSPSRKRRRTGASQSARADPPSPPLSGFTQHSEAWSMTASAEESQVVDDSSSEFLSAATSTQMSDAGRITRENEVEESVALSAATQPAGGDMSGAGGAGRGGSSAMVTSLFTTGSGRAVSVSKERLQAYETKLQAAEESVALSAATQPAGGDMSGAGGAGRGGSSAMVTSLFTTGSGRAVSVSKERLQAYETKLQAAEESVALSAATQPAGGDMSGAGGAGRGGSSAMVTSLFTTGSGRAVSVSKERLQAYETKLQAAEESVALSAATLPAGGDMSGAGGAGRGGSSAMVTSLFTTGSGRAVSVSKERLQAYETKLQAAEESVALSAATQPAGGDMSGAGGAGRGGSSAMVTSLFTTGSGRAVSVSKERLQAYETKLQAAEESVALSAATLPAGGDMSGAGGAGRGGSSAMVTSLFTTGSGRAVSVSKERLQAYETKLQAAEESVALSAATQPAGGDMSGAGGAGRGGSSAMVTSLFTTGSGRAVSVSKERLQAYETKLQAAEESVALSAATQPAGGDMSGAGGAGRGGSSAMVTSLFTTGSGRAVSVSKERLQAYETKLQAAEESVALSAATQPAGGDMSGAGGAGRGGSSAMVTSLFTTGSGRAVSVSKERLQAYETKLQAAEESVALSAATQPAGGDMSGAGGAGRGGSSAMVTSLFTTGSGRAVSVSKERLQAYETKLQAAEESVALSAATQPAGGDMSGAGGAGRGGSSAMVTSLFTTGSGRAVSVSKERLQAYETKLQAAEESVALSAATLPAGGDMSGAGGAGRGGSSAMVTSLFTTGSGRAVSVSKERLQAYETKLQAAEESVALSAATQPAGGDMSGAGGAGRGGSSAMVTSLFTTGSGRAVSVSKERLQAYETKLQAAEESVALSAATQPAGGDMSGAGGAGRGGSSAMVTSLFTTGSGRAVSVSKERLQAYETKLQAAEESVALSAATQPAGGDMSGAGGAGRGGSSAMVTSLFTTGSGRAVSVSKERLQAYETKLQAAEESVALSAATQPAGGDMSGAGGAGRGGSSAMVTSLFTTGSGRAVSVSKERLQAYETKLQAAEESVALSAATQPAGGDMSGAGGAGRGGSSAMVTSLFTTGSGRAVSVSKERLQAYETKLQAAEESVALSAATQPAGGDMSGAGGAGRGGSSAMATSLFTTGSGRAVSVSKERLQAYETKLQAAEESVALSAATQPAGGDMSGAGGAGRGGSSAMVTSLFTTGSGRAVSVSKERLQAYETKLQAAEESVALSAATQPAGGDMSGAGGAGRGGSSAMVTSLFTTGSGRAVSVSKERLQAYETKLQAAEESVALSAATQPAGGDMSGAGGAGRGGSSAMATSLFTTGSGRAVSVSKERLQAYETKLQAAEESVALSAATQPAGGDMSGAGGAGRGGSSAMATSLFTTGSGRAVSVSKERLQAYETKLQAAEESVALSAATQPAGGDMSGAGGAGRGGSSAMVTSLFTTGSGRAVSVSKERLQAYETKLQAAEESVALSAATQPAGGDMSGAGGAGRGGSSAMVTSLFTTGSGRAVSVSKERLQAYETKLQAAEESVALSAATQPAGGDMSGAGGAGRGGSSAMVTSLFTTGSGRAVSVSKERLQAYETKLQAAEESVALSAATQPAGGDMSGAGGAGRGGSSAMATSLFTTGSGRAVSVSKERLQAYETKLQAAEESVALSAATQPAGGDMSGAGGAGRGGSSAMVTSLFTTGSGRAVSVSKERLQAYETKLQAAEESVALSAATQPAGGDMSGAGGAGRGGSSAMVTSLFTTGSGRAVSVSKERLQAYETKLQAAEESVALSAATQPAGGDMSGAGGAGRGGSSAMVTSLFTTGSGRAVSVSKERLQAYETKLQAAEESVALSAATQPAGGDMSGAGGAGRGGSSAMVTSLFTTGSGRAVSVSKERLQTYETKLQAAEESVALSAAMPSAYNGFHRQDGNAAAALSESGLMPKPRSESFVGDSSGELSGRLRTPLNAFASNDHSNGAAASLARSQAAMNATREISSQHARGADKENAHPENVLVRQTAALEASKWRTSLGSKQLNCRLTAQTRGQQIQRQQHARRALKPTVGSRTSLSGTKRFRPPVASKKTLDNVASKGLGEPRVPKAPSHKKQKARSSEGRPFIYEETMKISFSLLMALRDDRELDQEMTGGGCYLSRFQVLDCITAENALDVRFTHDGGLVCSPESPDDATIGPRELYRQLKAGNYILKSTGATFAWFLNHYRWIVWKLAAMERSFPRLLMDKYLTKDQILKQITHRYQRDLNNAQRSIIKKILQRDASSLSCMVLCVAAVLPFPAESNHAVDQELPPCWNMALVLTDGWYSVYAVPDAPLATVLWKLHSKSNLVGTKLATWNASLQNSTEGIDPLECAIVREAQWKNPLLAKEDLTQWPYLQLRYNSTRRVRFDTQLGVEKLHHVTPATSRHRKQQPQLTFSLLKSVPLKSLEVGGGMVRSVRVRVLRVSPVLHLQSKEWTLGPRIICEDQLPQYFQLRSEYARMATQKNHKGDDDDMMMMDKWSGGDNQIDVPPPIPFIKVDVECTHPCANENQGLGCGILTIWRPSEELLAGGLKEGAEYFASSLTVNWKVDGGRGQDAFLRLSSTKHSGFEEIPEEDAMTDGGENGNTQAERSRRVCVDVQQATTDYRTNFENGLDGRRNEKRPTIDVCVCVVLVAGRETQDESSIAAKRQSEVSLLDPALKPKESRYVEHVFATDQSGHLMSIRVSGMEVTMPKKKAKSPLKRGASSSFVFRRGNKNTWKEGAILCLSGLEVSHYDEQLRVLDCVLVESTQIVSFPSKKSPFWDNFHALQRELGVSTARGSPSQAPSGNFAGELTQLKKYVERDILRMDFVPSQEYTNEHHVEVVEQERLTQDLQAHEEGGDTITNDQGGAESSPPSRHLRWDGSVVKVLPLLGSSKVMFPRDVVAFVCLNMTSDDKAFRTVYLTRELLIAMKSLLLEASTHAPEQLGQEEESQASETDFALVQSVTRVLAETKRHTGDCVLRFEVRPSTNERLINSWKPWERLHASYWMGVTVSTA